MNDCTKCKFYKNYRCELKDHEPFTNSSQEKIVGKVLKNGIYEDYIEFEENRFFPVTKALEYQNVE